VKNCRRIPTAILFLPLQKNRRTRVSGPSEKKVEQWSRNRLAELKKKWETELQSL